jgi:hypothetical protein
VTPTTLAAAWDAELVDLPIDIAEANLQALRRMFYRGALAAATSSLTREQLLAELVAHGRSVGTPAERARA